jgi:acyl-CoA thioester hydrolase
MPRPEPPRRRDYAHFERVTTRWTDNDVYGHVNNAHYYSFFDTAINQVLIARGALDIRAGGVVGLVVRSSCDYFGPVQYPEPLEVGLRTDRIGRSSVEYGVAIFSQGEDRARASGSMIHVFVDQATSRPVPVPPAIRSALEALALPGPG